MTRKRVVGHIVIEAKLSMQRSFDGSRCLQKLTMMSCSFTTTEILFTYFIKSENCEWPELEQNQNRTWTTRRYLLSPLEYEKFLATCQYVLSHPDLCVQRSFEVQLSIQRGSCHDRSLLFGRSLGSCLRTWLYSQRDSTNVLVEFLQTI